MDIKRNGKMKENYTPMMTQYREIKQQHPDEILFFRLGDFYEMFFEDAHLASRELDIVLTGRDGGMSDKIPMCGVPYHAADGYIAKLIKKGYKIAICEQVEDPKTAKGIVKREVIKIITPGTAMNDQVLDESANQYLVLLYEEDAVLCLCAVDISTGECVWSTYTGTDRYEKAYDLIYQFSPAELVRSSKLERIEEVKEFCAQKLPSCIVTFWHPESIEHADTLVKKHFDGAPGNLPPITRTALGYLLSYLYNTLKTDLKHINRLKEVDIKNTMVLDATALRNLEIIRNMRDGSKKDTLLSIVDFTNTAMGARQIKRWLEAPLTDARAIRRRQDVIKELLADVSLREDLKERLSCVSDIERILARLETGCANARDLSALSASLSVLPAVKTALFSGGERLKALSSAFELHSSLYTLLFNALVDSPPFSVREGGMIKDGYDMELDQLKAISRDSRDWMSDFESRQRVETGIKNLKVGYNKVFGYYIEVTKSNISSVPDSFVRKQTLTNAERYIVPELKEFENKILGAQERIEQLEYHIFTNICEKVRGHILTLQNTARVLADIDVYLSLAVCADRYNYVCPEITERKEIVIKDGRHPVVERILKKELFVPNDSFLNMHDNRTLIITGPNMAGKSTYMRQVALLVLLAQTGSFIPAREAAISPVDRIFTRVGASDDLASGQSTFMVEMTEVAQILRYATDKSLIILDEVGRGTSTYDGMSIARAVIEHISGKVKAKTLFATHYHELIDLENFHPDIKNYSVAVKEKGNQVAFLRRIIPGGADKSYGIHVAQLAGLPKSIIQRAQSLLDDYSAMGPEYKVNDFVQDTQTTLFTGSIAKTIVKLDISTMTPLEALNKLYELQRQAKEEAGMP